MRVKLFDLEGLTLELEARVTVKDDEMTIAFDHTRSMNFAQEFKGYGVFYTVDEPSRPFAIGVEVEGIQYGYVYYSLRESINVFETSGGCFRLKDQQVKGRIEDLDQAVRLLRQHRQSKQLAEVRKLVTELGGLLDE